MRTWNSRTASWLKVARTAPTMGSLLSSPSTMMLFERARWPVKERPEVADAPCCGVLSRLTPGVMTEKLMKLRPLMGRFSICCWPTTDATAVRVRIHDADLLGHGDVFAPSPQGEREVEVQVLAEVEGHAFAPLRREALHLGGDPVGAGRQGADEVAAAGVAVTVREVLVSTAVAVTVAPATAAADGSRTMPRMSAPVSRDCARVGDAAASPRTRARTAARFSIGGLRFDSPSLRPSSASPAPISRADSVRSAEPMSSGRCASSTTP